MDQSPTALQPAETATYQEFDEVSTHIKPLSESKDTHTLRKALDTLSGQMQHGQREALDCLAD